MGAFFPASLCKTGAIIALLSLSAMPANAASISIVNPNFEVDGVVGDVTLNGTPADAPTGWYNSGFGGDLYDLTSGQGKGGTIGLLGRRDVHQVWQVLSHGWSSTDQFTLNFWAKDWFATDPTVEVSIYESDADDSNLADNPLLWTQTTGIAADGGTDFSMVINASTFTGGTEGNNIVLRFGSPTSSNTFYSLDEVTLDVVPEPSSFLLLISGSMLLLVRRRK